MSKMNTLWGEVLDANELPEHVITTLEQAVLKAPQEVFRLLEARARALKYTLIIGALDQSKERKG